MTMVACPECGTRISDSAKQCPFCGYQSDNALAPLNTIPLSHRQIKVVIPQASIFDDDTNLIKAADNAKVVNFLTDAGKMATFAPEIFQTIEKIRRGDTKYIADFSKKAEELLKSGELVFSIEKKTGDLLPQLRRIDNGQVYEKARIHLEDVPADITPTICAIQNQINANEIMRKIEAVSEDVSALRLEAYADRIAKANSVWVQLHQAVHIQDARLREQKILDITAAATDTRCMFEEYFKVQVKLLKEGKGTAKAKGTSGNNALTALTTILQMTRTEYVAYSLLGEDDTALLSLKLFKDFVCRNKLDDKQTLLILNSYSSINRESIVKEFNAIANDIKSFEFKEPKQPAELPENTDKIGEGTDE